MEILQFLLFLLAMTDLTRGIGKYNISTSGTIWLGESITLTTEKIDSIERPVIWDNNGAKYECENTCSDDTNYKVTQIGTVSTLWINKVSWENSYWKFSDANFNTGEINMEPLINVKPKIEINNKTNCEYEVIAKCSLPQTSVECFIGDDPVTFTSNITENCTDNKTFTTHATVTLKPGILKCHFTIYNIFNKTITENITNKCETTTLVSLEAETTTLGSLVAAETTTLGPLEAETTTLVSLVAGETTTLVSLVASETTTLGVLAGETTTLRSLEAETTTLGSFAGETTTLGPGETSTLASKTATSRSCTFRGCINLVIGIIFTVIMYMY